MRGLAPILCGVLLVGACKKNSIDASTDTVDVGEQCGERDDAGCGVGAVCVLGFCRSGCTTDAECSRGSICIGDRAPFGCALPAELACSSTQPCESPLVCGIDGKCRQGCEVTNDCPRNEQTCIEGACVSSSDPDPAWKECQAGETTCGGVLDPSLTCNARTPAERPEECDTVYACHHGTPGWSKVAVCDAGRVTLCGAPLSSDLRYASCGTNPSLPLPACVDVLETRVPGADCVLNLPTGFDCSEPAKGYIGVSFTLLIDGKEVTDGVQHDCSTKRTTLDASACTRLKGGTLDLRVRVCPPDSNP